MLAEYTVGGLHDFLASEVESLPRSTPVLDLGCGSGAWLARLRHMGFSDLTGVDLNPPTIDGIRFVHANLDRDRPSLGRFGLVTSLEVIEHLENPGNLLHIVAESLDGFALITTPNIHSLRARARWALTDRMPSFDEKGEPSHITPILLPALRKVADRYSLRIERAWTYPEKETLTFGRPIRALAAIAGVIAPDPLPGDLLCMKIIKVRVTSVTSTLSPAADP